MINSPHSPKEKVQMHHADVVRLFCEANYPGDEKLLKEVEGIEAYLKASESASNFYKYAQGAIEFSELPLSVKTDFSRAVLIADSKNFDFKEGIDAVLENLHSDNSDDPENAEELKLAENLAVKLIGAFQGRGVDVLKEEIPLDVRLLIGHLLLEKQPNSELADDLRESFRFSVKVVDIENRLKKDLAASEPDVQKNGLMRRCVEKVQSELRRENFEKDNVMLYKLTEAIQANNRVVVLRLLKKEKELKSLRDSPLVLAVNLRNTSMMKILVENGISPNASSDYGWTPLMAATRDGFNEVAYWLIKKGADLSKKNWEGRTALIEAVSDQNIDLVYLFLSRGADPNEGSLKGTTPLEVAQSLENEEIVQLLKSRGATEAKKTAAKRGVNVDSKTVSGESEFNPTEKLTSEQVTEKLGTMGIVLGRDLVETFLYCLDAGDEKGIKAVETILRGESFEKEFEGMKLNERSIGDGRTMLMKMVNIKNILIAKFLLSNGADPNIPDNIGRTPLYEVACQNNMEMVELLLQYGANPNQPDHTGETPLFGAAMNERYGPEVFNLLTGGSVAGIPKEFVGKSAKEVIAKRVSIQFSHMLKIVMNPDLASGVIVNAIKGYVILAKANPKVNIDHWDMAMALKEPYRHSRIDQDSARVVIKAIYREAMEKSPRLPKLLEEYVQTMILFGDEEEEQNKKNEYYTEAIRCCALLLDIYKSSEGEKTDLLALINSIEGKVKFVKGGEEEPFKAVELKNAPTLSVLADEMEIHLDKLMPSQ